MIPASVLVIRAGRIEHSLRSQWHAFVHLSEAPAGQASSETRIFSGAGNRYDYWRIAWNVFTDHPLAGIGAGNYASYYYLQRHTQEAIENPHSLELQTLSELGCGGRAAHRLPNRRRLGRGSAPARRPLIVRRADGSGGGGGAFVVWLVDTSGDWMHLLPGVSAIGLLAAAVLCCEDGTRRTQERPASRRMGLFLVGGAAVALLLIVSGANLMRQGLAQRYLSDAHKQLAHDPASAIRSAQSSLRLDAANLDAYYVAAAGQARFDRASAAYSTLFAAVDEDPHQFVTWVLLGDLEVRLRNFPWPVGFMASHVVSIPTIRVCANSRQIPRGREGVLIRPDLPLPSRPMWRRSALALVVSLGLLAASLGAPARAGAFSKAIWGPVYRNGVNQFPIYKQLGVSIYEDDVDWFEVAQRGRDTRQPRRPGVPLADRAQAGHRASPAVPHAGAAADHRTPGWANGGRSWNWVPNHLSDFSSFAAAAAREYPGVKLWMVWGEPDRKTNFEPLYRRRTTPPGSTTSSRSRRTTTRGCSTARTGPSRPSTVTTR